MAANTEKPPPWKTTVIISTTLKEHGISGALTAQQHRLRLSDRIHPGAIIFPSSGTAFLLVELPVLEDMESALIERIHKFVEIHRNCFIVVHTSANGNEGLDVLTLIQNRFFGRNLKVLPAQSQTEIVNGMLKIAKATSKPYVSLLQGHMSLAKAHIIKTCPVWAAPSNASAGDPTVSQ